MDLQKNKKRAQRRMHKQKARRRKQYAEARRVNNESFNEYMAKLEQERDADREDNLE